MGSPVSIMVAEIVIQSTEKQALATYGLTLPFWFRYVDNTITALHDDDIDQVHNHVNSRNCDIQFTKEIEEKGSLPFVDCLVKRDSDELRTTVYRKPTHTDRLLDESSYNPPSHSVTTIKTSTRRAQLICDSPDALRNDDEELQHVFRKNNYNSDVIKLNTYKNHEIDETSYRTTTTATISYVRGTSEIISRILRPCNIRVAQRPITALRNLLTYVKDKDHPRDRQGVIYKMKCADCQGTYIGETGRNLNTRLTEHKRATKNGDRTNHIAEHHRQTKHNIDWDSAACMTYSTNYKQRLTLESWFTNLEPEPLNRSQQLPAPYKKLIQNLKQTARQYADSNNANDTHPQTATSHNHPHA